MNDGINVLGACARQTKNNHEICAPRMRNACCSMGSSVSSGEATTAHLSASKTCLELEEVGAGSDLEQVLLHGALGVSRRIVLLPPLLLSAHTAQSAHRSLILKSPNLRAHVHPSTWASGCSELSVGCVSQHLRCHNPRRASHISRSFRHGDALKAPGGIAIEVRGAQTPGSDVARST